MPAQGPRCLYTSFRVDGPSFPEPGVGQAWQVAIRDTAGRLCRAHTIARAPVRVNSRSPAALAASVPRSPAFLTFATRMVSLWADDSEEVRVSSIVKKRRKAMNKHKHRKRLRRERWQRRHG